MFNCLQAHCASDWISEYGGEGFGSERWVYNWMPERLLSAEYRFHFWLHNKIPAIDREKKKFRLENVCYWIHYLKLWYHWCVGNRNQNKICFFCTFRNNIWYVFFSSLLTFFIHASFISSKQASKSIGLSFHHHATHVWVRCWCCLFCFVLFEFDSNFTAFSYLIHLLNDWLSRT